MANYNPENAARLKHLASLANKNSRALNALDTKYNGAFRSLSVVGNSVKFFTSTDASGDPVATFDWPEEVFLDQSVTSLVDNFAWSAVAYPNSTNPNLDGKTVLVLGIKGDKETNPTVKYSFVSLEKLIDIYTAGDGSININGYTVTVKISQAAGNLLELKADGLFVGSDPTKLDKVTGAGLSNIAIFSASGAIVDSGTPLAELAELDTGTSYDVFTGATSTAAGLSGLVPAPQASDNTKFLRGDGTWSGELILPTVSSSVNGGFWLDASGAPPAPKFRYGGVTYTFGGISVLAPDYPYYWDTFIDKNYYVSGRYVGFEYIFPTGNGYEITVPGSALNWTLSSAAFQEGSFIECSLVVRRKNTEIEFPTLEQITLSGYAPTSYGTGSSQGTKPYIAIAGGGTGTEVHLVFYTARESFTEAQSAGSLTLTFNSPKYGQIPLKINWGLAADELMTAT